MPNYKAIKVFIASPSDLVEERKLFPFILEQINDIKAHSMKYHLQPLGWEDALPGFGRPQAIINEDVEDCDIFVMLLWKRWGTPSGACSSGTEEEFNIAHERSKGSNKPHLLMYFRAVPESMMADPGGQLQSVIAFRTRVEQEKLCFFRMYDEPNQWKELLIKHLCAILDKQIYGSAYATESEPDRITIPAGVQHTIVDLEAHLKSLTAKLETTQSKLRREAVKCAVKAMKLAEKGELTRAEEKYAKAIELSEEPEILRDFGVFLYHIGSLNRAKEIFERLLFLSEEGGNKRFQAIAHGNLGLVHKSWDDLERAEEFYKSALAIYNDLEDGEGKATAYVNLGVLYKERRELIKAVEFIKQALEIYTDLGLKNGVGSSLINLGNVYLACGYWDGAKDTFEEALRISSQARKKKGLAASYSGLGSVHLEMGNLEEALEMYRRSADISRSLGEKQSMAVANTNLGVIHHKLGDFVRARAVLEEALQLNIGLGRKVAMAYTFYLLGDVYHGELQLDSASDAWARSAQIYKELDNQEMIRVLQSKMESLREAEAGG